MPMQLYVNCQPVACAGQAAPSLLVVHYAPIPRQPVYRFQSLGLMMIQRSGEMRHAGSGGLRPEFLASCLHKGLCVGKVEHDIRLPHCFLE